MGTVKDTSVEPPGCTVRASEVTEPGMTGISPSQGIWSIRIESTLRVSGSRLPILAEPTQLPSDFLSESVVALVGGSMEPRFLVTA